VQYTTSDGTAMTADSDYVAASGTVTFNPGETSKTITVNVNGDTKFEQNETFFVGSDRTDQRHHRRQPGVGTIVNDDTQPTIAINDVSHDEATLGRRRSPSPSRSPTPATSRSPSTTLLPMAPPWSPTWTTTPPWAC